MWNAEEAFDYYETQWDDISDFYVLIDFNLSLINYLSMKFSVNRISYSWKLIEW